MELLIETGAPYAKIVVPQAVTGEPRCENLVGMTILHVTGVLWEPEDPEAPGTRTAVGQQLKAGRTVFTTADPSVYYAVAREDVDEVQEED